MGHQLLTGWNIWIERDGQFRNLSVAEPDKAAAEGLVGGYAPGWGIVYSNELSNAVMRFLKAKPGQIIEWVSGDPNTPIEPLVLKHKG
jgi:hypothetical protein